jgi:hypothetical protein
VSIEIILGSPLDDILVGDDAYNEIYPGKGNDIIDGKVIY